MKLIIKSAKTIEEAIEAGLKELGLRRSEAEFEVMQEPSKGVFGLFGGSDAVVKIKEKQLEKVDLGDIFAKDELFTEASREEVSFETSDEDYLDEKYQDEDFDTDSDDVFVEEEVYLQELDEDDEDFDVKSEEVEVVEVYEEKEKVEYSDEDDYGDENDLYEDGVAPVFEEEKNTEVKEEQESEQPLESTEEYEEDYSDDEEDDVEYEVFSSNPETLVNTRDLEFSGEASLVNNDDSLQEAAEKIKKTLEDLLVKMHIETKVSYETYKDNVININLSDITENDTGIVIGSKGETLNAIQYVLSLIVNRDTNKYYRVSVNVGDYRDRRKKSIEQNAQRVAYKVLKTKKSIALKPMNSYERRIVHYSLQSYKQIETVSTGKFPNRKVVIKYKGF